MGSPPRLLSPLPFQALLAATTYRNVDYWAPLLFSAGVQLEYAKYEQVLLKSQSEAGNSCLCVKPGEQYQIGLYEFSLRNWTSERNRNERAHLRHTCVLMQVLMEKAGSISIS